MTGLLILTPETLAGANLGPLDWFLAGLVVVLLVASVVHTIRDMHRDGSGDESHHPGAFNEDRLAHDPHDPRRAA